MFEYNVPFTVTFQGLVPVKDTLKFALCPELILVLPDNDAVAPTFTVKLLPLSLPVNPGVDETTRIR